MVEVTQADMVAADAQAEKHYMDLREAFATHRQLAANNQLQIRLQSILGANALITGLFINQGDHCSVGKRQHEDFSFCRLIELLIL